MDLTGLSWLLNCRVVSLPVQIDECTIPLRVVIQSISYIRQITRLNSVLLQRCNKLPCWLCKRKYLTINLNMWIGSRVSYRSLKF